MTADQSSPSVTADLAARLQARLDELPQWARELFSEVLVAVGAPTPEVLFDGSLRGRALELARLLEDDCYVSRARTVLALADALDAALAREQRLREALDACGVAAENGEGGNVPWIVAEALSRPAPEQP